MDISTSKLLLAAASGGADSATPTSSQYVEDVFSTHLYEGTGSAITITNGVNLSTGGLAWVKARTSPSFSDHILVDSARGNYQMQSNTQAADNAIASFNFDTTGFTVPANARVNSSGHDYVSWSFKQAPGFFDVVTFTGNGSNQTIAHNLGSVPGVVIVKKRNSQDSWHVYHRSIGNTKYARLESTDAFETRATAWNNTTPTSTHFTVGADGGMNATGDTFIAYLFAHDDARFGPNLDESIIKCGIYNTGSSSIVEVDLGFEPQWILMKRNLSGEPWMIADVMRDFRRDGTFQRLSTNAASAEANTPSNTAPTSTGIRTFGNVGANQDYIYIAIRRPHKPPTSATEVFAMDTGSVVDGVAFTSGFPVDAALSIERSNTDPRYFMSRLMGEGYFLNTASTSSMQSGVSMGTFDHNNGWYRVGSANQSWMFKRAPGFFDLVQFTGNGNSNGFNHNLGVKPELVIFKSLDANQDWIFKFQDNDNYLYGQSDSAQVNFNNYFDAEDTASLFYGRAGNAMSNQNGTNFIALLFATLAGISKVGSYTGNGSYQSINCGFAGGPRFVLIKRTDSSGHWFFWDSLRGITQGADPYLRWSGPAATEFLGNKNYLYPASNGFGVQEIGGTNNPNINVTNANYIFLAIA